MIIAVNFQSKQLERRSLKKIRASTGFEPVTSALPVHCSGHGSRVTGSNPVEALIFFRLLLSNCLNWKIYCDDHSSLSSTTAVQNELFHILHIKILCVGIF